MSSELCAIFVKTIQKYTAQKQAEHSLDPASPTRPPTAPPVPDMLCAELIHIPSGTLPNCPTDLPN
eukprot:352926-Chlamydomonas_euryale.AAC.11